MNEFLRLSTALPKVVLVSNCFVYGRDEEILVPACLYAAALCGFFHGASLAVAAHCVVHKADFRLESLYTFFN